MSRTGERVPEYARRLGERLRAVRRQRGLSLDQVERKSAGRWKTAAVGFYERGERMVTMGHLAELAAFYGVPVAELLPEEPRRMPRSATGLVLDLARLAALAGDPLGDESLYPRLSDWVGTIRAQRGDWGGRVLTVRASDVRTLVVLTGRSGLVELLRDSGVAASGDRLAELTGPSRVGVR